MECRKKRIVWTEEDEKMLLEKWEERANDLRRAKRNAHIYNDMSLEMNGKFTGEEIHIKIKNLAKKYREEKSKIGPSGGSPSDWKYYNAVHRIVGGTALNNAPTIESFSWNSTSSQFSSDSPMSISSPSPSPAPASLPLSSLSPASVCAPLPPSTTLSPTPSPLQSPSCTPVPTLSPLETSATGRKRKHSNVEKILQQQTELLKTVVDDTKVLTGEIVNAIRQHNESSEKLLNVMERIIERI